MSKAKLVIVYDSSIGTNFQLTKLGAGVAEEEDTDRSAKAA